MNIKEFAFNTLLLLVPLLISSQAFPQQPELAEILPQLSTQPSPQAVWPVLFDYPLPASVNQPWGVETDGHSIFVSTPYAPYKFARYDSVGNWIENFNIPGVTASVRDLTNDGIYWWGITYSSPSQLYKMNLVTKTLIATISLPTTLVYGYHIAYDEDLYGGNGGFYLGGYQNLFTCDNNGWNLMMVPGYSQPGSYHYTYGCAIDKYSEPGSTILWIGDMATGPYDLRGFKLSASPPSWIPGLIQPIPGTTPTVFPLTYGLTESFNTLIPCKSAILGIKESNSSYNLFALELFSFSSLTATNPGNAVVLIGDTAHFTTIVTGPGTINYQWQVSNATGTTWTNLSNSGPYSGVDSPVLSVNCNNLSLNQTHYRCYITSGCVSITASALLTIQAASVIGKICYANPASTPLPFCSVFLKQGNTIIAQTMTNVVGDYSFQTFPLGTYTIEVMVTNPWGGVNSLDALQILNHFAGITPLTGLALVAADVNLSSLVNSVDVLLVAQRSVGLISSFPAGDWVSNNTMMTFTGPLVQTMNITVLFTGDVNGSYFP